MRRAIAIGLVLAGFLAAAAPAAALPSMTPASATFPETVVGFSNAPQTFTLRARCYTDPADMTGNTCLMNDPFTPVFSTTGDFAIVAENCPPTMPGNTTFGTTCGIQVVFAPKSTGPLTGELRTGSDFARSALSGTGIALPCPAAACGSFVPVPVPQTRKCVKIKKKKRKGKKRGRVASDYLKCKKGFKQVPA